MIDKEGDTKSVGINGAIAPDQEQTYDLTRGVYDTKVTTGASHTTQRQEASEFFNTVVMKNPDLMNVMGDLLFKYSVLTDSSRNSDLFNASKILKGYEK